MGYSPAIHLMGGTTKGSLLYIVYFCFHNKEYHPPRIDFDVCFCGGREFFKCPGRGNSIQFTKIRSVVLVTIPIPEEYGGQNGGYITI